MGVNLYIAKYEHLYGGLYNDEIDFITDCLAECDGGSYVITNKIMSDIEKELSDDQVEKEKFRSLLDALHKGLAKENGYLELIMW